MADTKYVVTLTKSQIENLADFIEFNLINQIRNDLDIDNIEYVEDMCCAYRKLRNRYAEIVAEEQYEG